MRKSDWALVILLALVAGFTAFIVTNSITGSQRKPNESVETSIEFSDKVATPSEFLYSSEDGTNLPINPTVVVNIGTGDASHTENNVETSNAGEATE